MAFKNTTGTSRALTIETDYTISNARFNSPNAAEATIVTATINLTDSTMANNFTLPSSAFSNAASIEKRPVTIKADNKSVTRGNPLPAFTYTVDGQLPGETALTGEPQLATTADGKTAIRLPFRCSQ